MGSGSSERLALENCFSLWADELTDVNLKHLDFARGVVIKKKNQIIQTSCEPGW